MLLLEGHEGVWRVLGQDQEMVMGRGGDGGEDLVSQRAVPLYGTQGAGMRRHLKYSKMVLLDLTVF